MDQERFDAITRIVAAAAERRAILRWLTGSVVGGLIAIRGGEVLAAKGRVTICHFPPGQATRGIVKTVPREALSAHLGHGDFRITGKPGRTRAACRSTCKGGKSTCNGACCRRGQSCVLRHPTGTARICCPKHREFVECSEFFTCFPDERTCCPPPEAEISSFCCPEKLLCGFVCCLDGSTCLNPTTGECSCSPAQLCGPACCPPGIACANAETGECDFGVSFKRLRRP